jgi:hypothetical protein
LLILGLLTQADGLGWYRSRLWRWLRRLIAVMADRGKAAGAEADSVWE